MDTSILSERYIPIHRHVNSIFKIYTNMDMSILSERYKPIHRHVSIIWNVYTYTQTRQYYLKDIHPYADTSILSDKYTHIYTSVLPEK